jgi:hypothetical protein
MKQKRGVRETGELRGGTVKGTEETGRETEETGEMQGGTETGTEETR